MLLLRYGWECYELGWKCVFREPIFYLKRAQKISLVRNRILSEIS